MRRTLLPFLAVGALLSLAGPLALAAGPAVGQGSQDALRAAGPQSAHILELWRLTLGVCTVVFAGILVAFVLALRRSPRGDETQPADTRSLQQAEPVLVRRVGIAVAVSTVLLLFLIGASAWTDRSLGQLPLGDALHVRVTAAQWWWNIEYDDADPSRLFTTANELHVPVGRPVILTLRANDVIHSFWVPNLAGKKDLIPGRTSQLTFRADRPGTYRGQCAEYCGPEHAWMAFVVVADPPEQYEAWAARQRQSASPPTDAVRMRGQQLFLSGTCVMCHNISGTDATGRQAPDLTHVGSRQALAAGALRNDARQMAAWISDPQRYKPGVNMPAHAYSPEDLAALVAYLEGLQ
jgi:cytochrome c oxidase subunit 2